MLCSSIGIIQGYARIDKGRTSLWNLCQPSSNQTDNNTFLPKSALAYGSPADYQRTHRDCSRCWHTQIYSHFWNHNPVTGHLQSNDPDIGLGDSSRFTIRSPQKRRWNQSRNPVGQITRFVFGPVRASTYQYPRELSASTLQYQKPLLTGCQFDLKLPLSMADLASGSSKYK